MKMIHLKAYDMCLEYGTLLYLTKFGSHLYGTNTPTSDSDYKGLFLPSKESLILQHRCNSLSWNTKEGGGKNSKDDIDVQLWSLHYWLELLRKGDTNALDLLFSYNTPCMEICKIDKIFLQYKDIIDIKNTKAYVSYAYSQAKKYGLKGSRMGIIKGIVDHIEDYCASYNMWDEIEIPFWDNKAYKIFDSIVQNFYHESYCFEKTTNNDQMLYICGKGYGAKIKILEMYDRLVNEYNTYGDRAKQAEVNEGVDWKALSHAVRCIEQMKELATKGRIDFPLKSFEMLKTIKAGDMSWKECEQLIVDGLEYIDKLLVNIEPNNNVLKNQEMIIKSFYA